VRDRLFTGFDEHTFLHRSLIRSGEQNIRLMRKARMLWLDRWTGLLRLFVILFLLNMAVFLVTI
jgi:hypothetical protein